MRFQYVAVDLDGRERSGGVDASDETQARAELRKRKLAPVRLAVASGGSDEREAKTQLPRAGAKLTHKQRLLVTRQLSTLIDAAVPVDEALGMIAAQQERAVARQVLTDVRMSVVEGQRLADALGRHPQSFSPLFRSAVAGGERSGQLSFVLMRLADYLGRVEAMRSKITAAMIYPAALSLVALIVVICLMIFVVPTLTEQFQSFEARLPLLTQILIFVSSFLTNFWPLLLLLGAVAAYIGQILWRREPVRVALDQTLLRAPLIGRWVEAVNASRFIRAVSTLVASGLPVLESVRASQESVSNRIVARAIGDMASQIEEGEQLSAAMRRSGVIPAMATYMAASGESVGELPKMLDKTADHLDQEIESFATSALSLLEPAIIVFMGGIVASIVLAIMLPVLQLNRLAVGG